MTADVLKVVGQVAGIGGIALGVFLLLFRDVVRKKIFPMLTREQGYRLLRLVLVLVWSVAILGVATWGYVATRPDPAFTPGHLDVTGVFVDDYRPDFDAVLDFRVVNRGNRPLSINRIRFEVLQVEEVSTEGALDFSAKYDLDISELKNPGDRKEVVVSQALQAGEVDRFAVVLTARSMGMGMFRVWELRPTLVTSEGDVAAAPITVGLPWNKMKSTRHPGL